MKPLTLAMRRVLLQAAKRSGLQVCPTPGLSPGAQAWVLQGLKDRDLIRGEVVPILTEAGLIVAREIAGLPVSEKVTR